MADVQKTVVPYTIQQLLIDAHGGHLSGIRPEIEQTLSRDAVAEIEAKSDAISRRIANEIMPEIDRWFADLDDLSEKIDCQLEPLQIGEK